MVEDIIYNQLIEESKKNTVKGYIASIRLCYINLILSLSGMNKYTDNLKDKE